MKLKAVCGIMLALLSIGILALAFNIQRAPMHLDPTDYVKVYVYNPAAASNVYPAIAYPNATYVEVWIDSPDAWFNTSSGIVGVTLSLGVNSSVVEVLTAQAMPDMDFGGFPDSFLGDFLEDAYPLDGFTTFFAVGTVDKPNGTITATADIILGFSTLGVGAGSGPKPLWRWVIRTQSGVDHTTAYSPLTILDAYYTTVDGVKHPIDIVESGHYGTPPPPGDVNGDGKVDASDLLVLSEAYGSALSKPNWNPNCDINGDGKVDASDLYELTAAPTAGWSFSHWMGDLTGS